MHPVENLRGTASAHLAGRTVVLGVCGSIAAVKAVELARELIRHGADVVPVMTPAATRILHPDALHFATGHPPVTRLTGAVEHVSLLGDVPGKADLLLVAPATANTVAKMALGIDDSPVTTCATVAFGTRTPVVVAPAMHEAMLTHPVVADHARALVKRLGVTWVEPVREEGKAKLAEVEAVVEAVIHRLALGPKRPGPLAGKRCLVISGATAEPVDPVRILTNRSSGRSGFLVATELRRLGAEVDLWHGHGTLPVPGPLLPFAWRFGSHGELMARIRKARLAAFDQVWMPAAIGDYAAVPAKAKIPSGAKRLDLELRPLPKAIEAVRRKAPKAILVAFKAESSEAGLAAKARERLRRYSAQFVVANTAAAFAAPDTSLLLVDGKGERRFEGRKERVLPQVVAAVAKAGKAGRRR
ncbi:MAG TPA: bifunctional phosphopantothenoylcysteine decarboxylase/phosphopantothenate--cysteine ligase CoaBC [Candidatus Thermoplasmatota archaeon]|nr:bifunctional phosphopantothenoylcysteine decarboxylase/phosphopantothenate--cysteine ligase CoaBC [Candidatus Thermoplasmatota archaeon]